MSRETAIKLLFVGSDNKSTMSALRAVYAKLNPDHCGLDVDDPESAYYFDYCNPALRVGEQTCRFAMYAFADRESPACVRNYATLDGVLVLLTPECGSTDRASLLREIDEQFVRAGRAPEKVAKVIETIDPTNASVVFNAWKQLVTFVLTDYKEHLLIDANPGNRQP